MNNPTLRKTYVNINGEKSCLNDFYNSYDGNKVSYNVFWQRVRHRECTESLLIDAISLTTSKWISFYGGGRRKKFTYTGNIYQNYKGETFPSLSAFLHKIGKYDKYQLIKSRLQRGWSIDKSIQEYVRDDSYGLIYAIKCKINNLIYIGQTIKSAEERFTEHKKAWEALKDRDKNNTRLLFQAFTIFGIDNFYIEVLEDNIKNQDLTTRENYWINKYNTLGASGLNMITGVNSPASFGVPIEYCGTKYSSIKSAVRCIMKERPDLPEYIIEKRIRRNAPLPKKARRHSKHPEAGSNLWKRWLSLVRKNIVCPEWEIEEDGKGYENFKHDMNIPPTSKHKLVRLNNSLPFSASNCRWMLPQEEREFICGQKIVVFGKTFDTLTKVADEYKISLSTLIYRIKSGLSPEDAVSRKKQTAPQSIYEDGKIFNSKREYFLYISKKYNISFGQAKDRYERNLPYDHVPKKGNQCKILGKNFSTEKEAVEYFELSLSSYNKKKKAGLSPEEAILALLKKKSSM